MFTDFISWVSREERSLMSLLSKIGFFIREHSILVLETLKRCFFSHGKPTNALPLFLSGNMYIHKMNKWFL